MAVSAVPGLPAGRYVVRSLVGHGAMGRVWQAWDTSLHRHVAIKEMTPPPYLDDAERLAMRARFLREAQAIARVVHPNVVRVHDVVDAPAGPLIVMEYVSGRSLRQVLDDGPLPVESTLDVAAAVLAALRAAHRVSVVHRDVKPGNILIDDDGRIVLTDFGIAKVVGYQDATQTGQIAGTPQYVAPERLRDRPPSPATDLWSLGVTLLECLTGRSPFARPTVLATLYAVAHDDPQVPRDSGALRPLLDGLLVKDPERRIDAARAEHLLGRVRQARPRRRAATVAVLALALVLAGGGAAAWWRLRPPADPYLAALQTFAGAPDVARCGKLGPLENQVTRRRCTDGETETYWVLYGVPGDDPATAAGRRDRQRAAILGQNERNSPPSCLVRHGSSPEGGRGTYIEYVYRAGDDNRDWVSIWWDDDGTDPGGAAVLNIRKPYRPGEKDPAAPLRALWQERGYRFTD